MYLLYGLQNGAYFSPHRPHFQCRVDNICFGNSVLLGKAIDPPSPPPHLVAGYVFLYWPSISSLNLCIVICIELRF
jgi:hypothetical protein